MKNLNALNDKESESEGLSYVEILSASLKRTRSTGAMVEVPLNTGLWAEGELSKEEVRLVVDGLRSQMQNAS